MSADLDFLATVKAELTSLTPCQTLTWHQHSRDVLMPLIAQLQPANLLDDYHDPSADGVQTYRGQALDLIRGGEHIPLPIFFSHTREPKQVPSLKQIQTLLSTDNFRKTESLDVQISSDAKGSEPRPKTIAEIRKRFKDTSSKPDPWNILGACKPGVCQLPEFLRDDICDLLPDVTLRAIEIASKVPLDEQEDADEIVETWKKALSWFLLAEAGALTTTHQDALGLGTWITCQQGEIGFAWLSRPTKDQTRRWQNDPDRFVDGCWRFKVLRAGQTVYFDPGLVHFVFRKNGDDQQTLAFGGHTLRRAIAGTCARILDEHVALITPKDVMAAETRPVPLPYNESISYVLSYGLELLEAMNKILSRGPALPPAQASMFQHYHLRLMKRFRAFRRIEGAVETANKVREGYAEHDREARAHARRQELIAGQDGKTDHSRPSLKRPRDDIDDADDSIGSVDSVPRQRKHSRAEGEMEMDGFVEGRPLRQRISPGRPGFGASVQGAADGEEGIVVRRRNPGRQTRPGRIRD